MEVVDSIPIGAFFIVGQNILQTAPDNSVGVSKLYWIQLSLQTEEKGNISPAGNRTPVSRVTGGRPGETIILPRTFV